MKKFILAALLFVSLASAAIARDNASLKVALLKEFPEAADINVRTNDSYTVVSFTWNNEHMQAFYDTDGKRFGISRAIMPATLPMKAQGTLQAKYAAYAITEAAELDDANNGRNYYVSLNNGKEALILEISAAGNVSIFKKSRLQ
ncbi:hypothetical protein [Deminuibacter soli]|nr:hypothetical protein [Deminuibacter soli]